MNNLELIGNKGINKKYRGIKDREKWSWKLLGQQKMQKLKLLGGKPTGRIMAIGQLSLGIGKVAWRLEDSLQVMIKRVGVAIGRKKLWSDRF